MAKKTSQSLLTELQSNLWYTIIPLTLIAGIFRILFIDLIEFKFDEAQALFVVTEFLQKPYLIQVAGVSSIGVNYFPLQYYMLAVLGFLTTDPIGLSFLIGVVNTLLIPIFYLIVKKYYGQLVGIIAALVLATSPWSVLFSRKIWNPDLILVLLIPAIWFFHRLIIDKQKKAVLPLFVLLTLLFQLQFSGLFLLVIVILILWRLKIKVNASKAVLGILLGFIPAIPYFIYQLTSKPLCRDCAAFFGYQGIEKSFDFYNFLRPFEIITGSYFQNSLGNDYANFISQFPIVNIFNFIFLVVIVVPLIGIYSVLKKRQNTFLAWLVILIPLIIFTTQTPARMYYFIILSPFVAIIYGLGVKEIFEGYISNKSQVTRKYNLLLVTFTVLVTIPFLINLVFMYFYFSFIGEKRVIDGDYGAIFPVTQEYIEQALVDYENYPNYDQLKHYSYMFADPRILHSKLGEYFAQKQDPVKAQAEFKKAIKINPQDTSSMANLVYILIVTGKIEAAKNLLTDLEKIDPANAAKLANILEQAELQRQEATRSGNLK